MNRWNNPITLLIHDKSEPLMLQRRDFALAAASFLGMPAFAQFRVEISGVGATQLPIAITRFRDEDKSSQPIATIVRADLERMRRVVQQSGIKVE